MKFKSYDFERSMKAEDIARLDGFERRKMDYLA